MSTSSADDRVARVAGVFDAAADDYDQSGVEFFGPIADRLVDALAPTAGERALDVGCGRGAVTLRLARAVGATGSVTAVDISPAMVEHTRATAQEAGLAVDVRQMDAMAPTMPAGEVDVLASSLVLFFLPDPAAALQRWRGLLRPGGRVGVSTFGPQDDTWRQVDALFAPYLPPTLLDARTGGTRGPFASDAGVEGLLTGAGFTGARSTAAPLSVAFDDADQWRRWSMGTGQRAFWELVPELERPRLLERAAELLGQARDGDRIVVSQVVRLTLADV